MQFIIDIWVCRLSYFFITISQHLFAIFSWMETTLNILCVLHSNNYSKTSCIALTTSCKNTQIFKTYIRSAGKYLLRWHSFMKWCLQIKQISGQYIVATTIIVLLCDNNHDVAFGINTTVNCFVATHHHYFVMHLNIMLFCGNTILLHYFLAIPHQYVTLCDVIWSIFMSTPMYCIYARSSHSFFIYFIFTFKIWLPWSAYVFK